MYAIKVINGFFNLYSGLIILRIFLTWIPSIDWNQQPFKSVREVSDMYLNIFRRFVPPMGGLDFSPIIALLVLQVLQAVIINIVATIFI